jgi:hypothetical protein
MREGARSPRCEGVGRYGRIGQPAEGAPLRRHRGFKWDTPVCESPERKAPDVAKPLLASDCGRWTTSICVFDGRAANRRFRGADGWALNLKRFRLDYRIGRVNGLRLYSFRRRADDPADAGGQRESAYGCSPLSDEANWPGSGGGRYRARKQLKNAYKRGPSKPSGRRKRPAAGFAGRRRMSVQHINVVR